MVLVRKGDFYTALNDMFAQLSWSVFTAQYELNLYAIFISILVVEGRAMTEAFYRRPLAAKGLIRSQGSPCGDWW
jgi:hypothetical protein